ncbi:MAG: hypothetical protein WCK27_23045, partial [Verrucomicrobiota bacterium]
PTGLAEKIGGVVVTINMSLLRSWPNPAHALDGWIPSLLIAGHHCPGLPEQGRSAGRRIRCQHSFPAVVVVRAIKRFPFVCHTA